MISSILTKERGKSLFLASKRSQAWGLDLMVATVIFLAGIIVLYIYAINYSSGQGDDLDDLFLKGILLQS